MDGIRDELHDVMRRDGHPPPAAWSSAVALITAELLADDDPDTAPPRVVDVIGDVDPLDLARATAWVAALLASHDRDHALTVLRRIGATAATLPGDHA